MSLSFSSGLSDDGTALTPEAESTGSFAPPPCLGCGACCFSTAANYVPVTGVDWTRLGTDPERWAEFTNNRAFMRMVDGHCAALVVHSPVEGSINGGFVCAVYEQRPQVCRDLSRGSPECHAEWTRKRVTARDAENQKG